MRIILNGETCEVAATHLDKILSEQGYASKTIATALNGTFVHKQDRPDTLIKEGDQLEVVAPIEGG